MAKKNRLNGVVTFKKDINLGHRASKYESTSATAMLARALQNPSDNSKLYTTCLVGGELAELDILVDGETSLTVQEVCNALNRIAHTTELIAGHIICNQGKPEQMDLRFVPHRNCWAIDYAFHMKTMSMSEFQRRDALCTKCKKNQCIWCKHGLCLYPLVNGTKPRASSDCK